ncbi:MAG: hypothetical protein A2452_09435 [Candidatus Firestonebacteria bacterium RIFOXYC2_FULL_39_67]|nr:MAG: hypothetical protein A2536_00025 [Candidatus Firestonebacteria bacterium RIFOXYD2_FULL_39_29]OGF55736.1 MAG: hypothetical protein A2452_09435 [Candidatus Firestonebacteria bacterium RIFOXYC2_FULL_39_67]
MIRFTLVLLISVFFNALSYAETPSWPTFQGVNQKSICPETGLLKSWPNGGLELLWKFEDCGKGYASVTISDGMIFTAGDISGENTVMALDMEGKLLWKQATGKAWKADYPGTRGTPTYDDGMTYHLSGAGMLAALNAKTGKPVWSLDLVKECGGTIGSWGLAESLLIDGNNILCMPGGKEAIVLALDKKTGKKKWATTGLEDTPSYCTPTIVKVGAVRQLLTMSAKYALGINADTGKLIWKFFYETGCDVHATTPLYKNGSIFITSNYGKDSKLLKLSKDGTSVKEVWSTHAMENHHGGVVLIDGYIYGAGANVWSCINFENGKTSWKVREGKGSILYADKMLYLLNESGKLVLIEATPKAYKEISSFELPKASKDTFWAHPVICDGKLYIRHANMLYTYDVKGK